VADLMSRCMGLKEEAATERTKVPLLADEVRRLKTEADLRQEEMRQLKGNLQAVATERDESQRMVAEASLHVDSLSKHLEAARSEGQALRAPMGGTLLKSHFVCSSLFFLVTAQHFCPLSSSREGYGDHCLDLSDASPDCGVKGG
jgi:biotin carboxyl carrier protein